MKVLATCNQKGGVGKTTTARNLARASIQQGYRTLAIDLDPQGNLTSVLAHEEMPQDVTGVADALSERATESLADVIVPTIWEGLDLAPTVGDALDAVRDELVVAGAGRESRLRRALEPLRDRYDVVIIDCRPALDQLTVNGLVAADTAVIVTNPDLFSANGIAQLKRTIETVREHYNRALLVGGVVINHHEQANTIQARHWTAQIRAAGLPVLEPAVPRHTWIGTAAARGTALDELGPDGQAIANIYSGYLTTLIGGTP